MNSVARLVERFNTVQDELQRLLEGLMKSGMYVLAAALDSSMVELSVMCRSAIQDVWEASGRDPWPEYQTWRGHSGLSVD